MTLNARRLCEFARDEAGVIMAIQLSSLLRASTTTEHSMEKSPQRGLNIYFMDGSSAQITFPVQTEDLYRRKLMIDDALKRRALMIEADGGLHFIPLDNVKYMSIFPAGDSADSGIIKGATFSV
jgi:hypothetical protein